MRKSTAAAASFAAIAIVIATEVHAETYRLIHAIGNVENESGRGLSKSECEVRKKELKVVAEALGTYNERLGVGSITCLPESIFAD